MVDKEARAELRIAVRRLITGRMTNDDFDEVYGKHWNSEDGAVASIAAFGWGLYSDTWTYRLKGAHAVCPEVRSLASRSILFLYTDQEYEWPPFAGDSMISLLAGLGRLGALASVALGLIFLLGLPAKDAYVLWVTGPPALFLIIIWLAVSYLERRNHSARLLQLMQLGYFDFWPFLRSHDLEKAKKTVQFFGPACSTAA